MGGIMTMYQIVLVDDEIYTRKGIRSLVNWQACGFEVAAEADNGEDALAVIEEIKPDLVITDIRMPVMDGLELIKQVKENKAGPQPSFIIISGYDDFKYAQQAVRYGVHDFILKPVDEEALEASLTKLHARIDEQKRFAREQDYVRGEMIISALIQGEIEQRQIVEWSQYLGVTEGDVLRYILIELNDLHPWQPRENAIDQEQIRQLIISVLSEQFGRAYYVYEHRNRYGFIWSDSGRSNVGMTMEVGFASLRRKLSDSLQTPVFLYVGKQVDHLRSIAESYQTAKTAALFKYVEEAKKLVVYEQIHDLQLVFTDLDQSWYGRFINEIEEQDESRIASSINELFDGFRTKRMAPEAIKLAIHQCVSGILKIMERMELDHRELSSLAPVVGWQDLNISPGELRRLFTSFISESGEKLAKHRKDNIKGGIQRIKSYIEAHYAENISLKGIAAEFYMNPVYLGQLFKKTYGMLFNDFLLQIRVDEAKKLLRQTDLRVYEVAERVGFSNADYFVTQFEKIAHMTPSEYRNKLL